MVAEKSAEGNDITMDSIPCFCRTSLKAASAEIALLFVKNYLSVRHCKRTLTASLYAHAAADTISFTPFYLYSAFDTNVIFFRFKAVVLTACDAELELVRKLPCEISFVKLLCKSVCIYTAAWTDRSTLTGCDSSYSRSANARFCVALCKSRLYLVDIVKLYKWYLNALT